MSVPDHFGLHTKTPSQKQIDTGAVANLVAEGHKPFKPQQIQPFQHVTPLNPGWRNCRRAVTESQTSFGWTQ